MNGSLFDVSGRVALVTGASRGLGKAIACGLAGAGADVVLVSRDERELGRAVDSISAATGREGRCIAADLSVRAELDRVGREAPGMFGRIDIVVNNAGGNIPQPIDEITDEAWDSIIELDLRAAMSLTRAMAAEMKQRGWGRIINVGSVLGQMSRNGRSAYSAAKAGLIGLTRGAAVDLGPYGVTVNCLVLGPFRTALTERSIDSEGVAQSFVDRTALLRWGEPADVVGPVVMLASEAGAYITGTSLVVDGGWLAK